MMKRVVITGMGIWSCIGQDLQTVTDSLKQGRSGVIFDPKRIEYGLQSGLVGNVPCPDLKSLLPRKFRATISEDSEYAYMAARQALEQAGISDEYLRQNEVGIIFGNDWHNSSIEEHCKVVDEYHSLTMLDPFSLLKEETSSVTMNLATIFHLRGVNLSISSVCISSSCAIGMGTMLIKEGLQDIILVGGANHTTLAGAAVYDAIEGFSKENDIPLRAVRPFDKNSTGTVFSNGAAALLIEEYEHAIMRGVPILAEIIGYGTATSGENDLAHLEANGIARAINNALLDANITAKEVDYVNAGSISSLYEDTQEALALSQFFANSNTCISSTESITGHECAMAGASETIYTILMMQNGFIAPSINLTNVIEQAKDLRIITDFTPSNINIALNSSLGGGNAYSMIVLRKI